MGSLAKYWSQIEHIKMEQNFSFSYDSDLNICLPNPVGVTDVHTYTLNQTVGDDASFTEWSSP